MTLPSDLPHRGGLARADERGPLSTSKPEKTATIFSGGISRFDVTAHYKRIFSKREVFSCVF
jgi:hypothetical protein